MSILDDYLANTVNKSWNFSGLANDPVKEAVNAVLGLTGEAGEVADIFKKVLFHRPKPEGRREELLLELGDVFYYLCKIVELSGFTFEQVLAANHEKLSSRYPVEFGVEQ